MGKNREKEIEDRVAQIEVDGPEAVASGDFDKAQQLADEENALVSEDESLTGHAPKAANEVLGGESQANASPGIPVGEESPEDDDVEELLEEIAEEDDE